MLQPRVIDLNSHLQAKYIKSLNDLWSRGGNETQWVGWSQDRVGVLTVIFSLQEFVLFCESRTLMSQFQLGV